MHNFGNPFDALKKGFHFRRCLHIGCVECPIIVNKFMLQQLLSTKLIGRAINVKENSHLEADMLESYTVIGVSFDWYSGGSWRYYLS